MMMNTYKLVIAYDGTDFQGWQSQPHRQTVVDVLQDTFKKVFGERISILGASRTDGGVHAQGQVAIFKTSRDINARCMRKAWNQSLPMSVTIRELELVRKPFHPHYQVKQKTYRYRLFLSRPQPELARFGWHYKFIHEVDLAKFARALQLYVGTHDFRSFCKLEEEKSTVRTVQAITIDQRDNQVEVTICGNGFLRYQIRRMIGYALDVARRDNLSLDHIRGMLQVPCSQQTLLKAEACGLCLVAIEYQ